MADPIKLLPHQSQPLPSIDLYAPPGSGKSVSRAMLHIMMEREIGKPSSGKSTFVNANPLFGDPKGYVGYTPRADIVTDVPLDLLNSEEIYALLMKGSK